MLTSRNLDAAGSKPSQGEKERVAMASDSVTHKKILQDPIAVS